MIKTMKRLALVIIVGLMLMLAPKFIGEHGYVLISLGQWRVEGSVVSFAVTLILASFAVWLTIWLTKLGYRTLVLPSTWWSWRQLNSQSNFLQSGIDFMALGQWQQASNQLKKVKRKERLQTAQQLQLVCAAHQATTAAHGLPSPDEKADSVSALFAQLTALKNQQLYSEALTLIDGMKKPVHKQALPMQQLCLDIRVMGFVWNDVTRQLPKLDKAIVKNNDEQAQHAWLAHLESTLTLGFNNYVISHSINQLKQLWSAWTRSFKAHPAVLNAYLAVLSQHQQHLLIEDALLQQNKQTDAWMLELIRKVYAQSSIVPMPKLFAKIQQKASKQPDSKVLITIMAYLAAGDKDYQLAKQALEQVVYSNRNPWDSRLYACTLAELGEMRHSVEVFKSLPCA